MKKEYSKEEFDQLIEEQVAARMKPILAKIRSTPRPGGPSLFNPNYHGDEDAPSKAAAFMEAFESEEVVAGPTGFKGLREFVRCVALAPGDERLTPASKALSEADPEAGGYLVPGEYLGRLLLGATEKSRFMGLCQSIPMKALTLEAPVACSMDESSGEVFGGVKFGWIDEGGDKPVKDFKLLKVKLLAHVAAAIARTSNQLLEDSSPRAEDVINSIFTSAFGWTVDNAILNGTGAGAADGGHQRSRNVRRAQGKRAGQGHDQLGQHPEDVLSPVADQQGEPELEVDLQRRGGDGDPVAEPAGRHGRVDGHHGVRRRREADAEDASGDPDHLVAVRKRPGDRRGHRPGRLRQVHPRDPEGSDRGGQHPPPLLDERDGVPVRGQAGRPADPAGEDQVADVVGNKPVRDVGHAGVSRARPSDPG